MVAIVLTLLGGSPAAPAPLESPVRLTLQLAGGYSPYVNVEIGAGVEAAWLPLRYLRLHAGVDAAMLQGHFLDGAFRMLAGVDGVLPWSTGELFLGFEAGASYNSAGGFDGAERVWALFPTWRGRAGIDFTGLRPIVVGVAAAWGYVGRLRQPERAWAELFLRIGFAF